MDGEGGPRVDNELITTASSEKDNSRGANQSSFNEKEEKDRQSRDENRENYREKGVTHTIKKKIRIWQLGGPKNN